MLNEKQNELEFLMQGEDAVAQIFSRYRDQLRRMVRFRIDHRLLRRVDYDDVLQDAYLEVSRRIQDYIDQPTVPFFVWARQITMQVLIDMHRRHLGATMRDISLEVSLRGRGMEHTTSYSLAAHLIGNVTSPSQAAVRDEAIVELREALDQMDDIDREVLVLRHLEELNNNDVADVLGLTKSTASKRYVRALKRLKSLLSKMTTDLK